MTHAILLHAMAVHAIAPVHSAVLLAWHSVTAHQPGHKPAPNLVPNPAPAAPPGLAGPMNTILGWGKWSVLICGVAGVLICGGKMALGHLTRSSNLAADAATHLPVVFLGLSLVAISAGVVGVFL
jgi:hypothetical protein